MVGGVPQQSIGDRREYIQTGLQPIAGVSNWPHIPIFGLWEETGPSKWLTIPWKNTGPLPASLRLKELALYFPHISMCLCFRCGVQRLNIFIFEGHISNSVSSIHQYVLIYINLLHRYMMMYHNYMSLWPKCISLEDEGMAQRIALLPLQEGHKFESSLGPFLVG